MKAYVKGLGAPTWPSICDRQMSGWLWIDSTPGAIHVASVLKNRPMEATHMWGWSRTEHVRLRLDRDLPGDGIVGARLRFGRDCPGTGWEEADVTDSRVRAWTQTDGRISATYPPSLVNHQEMRLWEVRRVPSGASVVSAPLTFIHMGDMDFIDGLVSSIGESQSRMTVSSEKGCA